MESLQTQNIFSTKIGRNDYCPCGSQRKYKKCCLPNTTLKNHQDFLIQESENSLIEKNSDDQSVVLDAETFGFAKMSEVILDYADEILSVATTSAGMEKAISLAIAAWNLSFLDETDRHDKMNDLLSKAMSIKKNTDQWNDLRDTIETLIDKRLTEYASFNRMIFDYNFVPVGSHDFRLNVVSTILD